MWDANVGTTERVSRCGDRRRRAAHRLRLDGQCLRRHPRQACRRNLSHATSTRVSVSYYDETKYRAHEAARAARRSRRAHRHCSTVAGLRAERPHADEHPDRARVFRQVALRSVDAIPERVGCTSRISPTASLRRSTADESASRTCSPAIADGWQTLLPSPRTRRRRKPPRMTMPTGLCGSWRQSMIGSGGLPGLPGEPGAKRSSAGDGVTYWASHDKATRELGFNPRSLEQGITDTWGQAKQETE